MELINSTDKIAIEFTVGNGRYTFHTFPYDCDCTVLLRFHHIYLSGDSNPRGSWKLWIGDSSSIVGMILNSGDIEGVFPDGIIHHLPCKKGSKISLEVTSDSKLRLGAQLQISYTGISEATLEPIPYETAKYSVDTTEVVVKKWMDSHGWKGSPLEWIINNDMEFGKYDESDIDEVIHHNNFTLVNNWITKRELSNIPLEVLEHFDLQRKQLTELDLEKIYASNSSYFKSALQTVKVKVSLK